MPSDPNTDQNQRLTRAQVMLLVVACGYLWIVSIRELFTPFLR
jgi:hypothetical protein